jgi:hypothetical protein
VLQPSRRLALDEGEVTVYFLQTFKLALRAGVSFSQLHEALFEVGIAVADVSDAAGMVRVASYGDVHACQLNRLRTMATLVATVGPLEVGATDKLTENPFPFALDVDVNLLNVTAPAADGNQSAVLTPQSYLEDILQRDGKGQAFKVLCSVTDGVIGDCLVELTWHYDEAELSVLVSAHRGIVAAVLTGDDSRRERVMQATRSWFGKQLLAMARGHCRFAVGQGYESLQRTIGRV